jgi:hypothetical protein
MHYVQQESLLSSIRKIFAEEKPRQKSGAEMRALTDDELGAVAGGPELEVDNGN